MRQSAAILLTNPDMLHVGILPNHSLWSKFLANLKYVVIDEAHVYRGIFGSQVACVLRRLLPPVPLLRRRAAVHLLLGDHRQPGRARRSG